MPDVTKGLEGNNELRSADLMAMKLKDPKVAASVAENEDRLDELTEASKQKVAAGPLAQAMTADRQVYRMAVMFIGWGSILAISGIIVICAAQFFFSDSANRPPDALVSFASTAIGALAGLLTPLGLRGQNN